MIKGVRKKILEDASLLATVLILFELILSLVFISLGYIIGNIYFRGVGVGLTISWVTSALVYYIQYRKVVNKK
jgi:Na+-driven multidrug efflux pump